MLTRYQTAALAGLSKSYNATFNPAWFSPQFDLPDGWVAGWIGGPAQHIYVGCSPEGDINS